MPYQPTFAIDAVGRPQAAAKAISLGIGHDLLWALMKANTRYLRAFPDHFKPLYGSSLVFGVAKPDPKKKCGDDLWRDVATVMPSGIADAKELAAMRAAELRVRYDVKATPMIRPSDQRIIVVYPQPADMPVLPSGKRAAYPSQIHVESGVIFEDPTEVIGAPAGSNIATFLDRERAPYRPTFVIDAVGRDETPAVHVGVDIMGDLLWGLEKIDRRYLDAYPSQFPPLYRAGIVYGDQLPEAGSACGDDDWRDVGVLYRLKIGDCEELASARVAELRRAGVRAWPMVVLEKGMTKKRRSRHLYHVMVRWPAGLPAKAYPAAIKRIRGMLVECPSERLGMKIQEAA